MHVRICPRSRVLPNFYIFTVCIALCLVNPIADGNRFLSVHQGGLMTSIHNTRWTLRCQWRQDIKVFRFIDSPTTRCALQSTICLHISISLVCIKPLSGFCDGTSRQRRQMFFQIVTAFVFKMLPFVRLEATVEDHWSLWRSLHWTFCHFFIYMHWQ